MTSEKKVQKAVFTRGFYEGYDLSHVALYHAEYFKKLLKISDLEITKNLIKQVLAKAYPFLTLCINHTPISPAIKAVCSATNLTVFQRKLEIAPTIARNASMAFPASLLSTSAILSNHFLKVSSSFDENLLPLKKHL